MKNRKTIEYIERALDSRMSDRIKQDWNTYLQQKPKTAHLFGEQQQVCTWLESVAAVEPPEDLRQRILTAIPQLKQKTHESFWQRLVGDVYPPMRRKMTLAFATGAAIGIAVSITAFFAAGKANFLTDRILGGNALLTRQFDKVETFDLPDVAGEISWNIDSADCMVRMALRPHVPVTASLQFNPAEFQISHFYRESWTGGGEVMVLPNAVRVSLPDANRFVFIIKHQGDTYSPMLFKLMTADSLLITKKLTAEGVHKI